MSPPPAYQQIKDHILDNIRAGTWAQGDQVPSENELARRFGVARMTVNRAVKELADEQILVRVQGTGTFVAEPKITSTLVEIHSIADEIAARGGVHTTEVLTLEPVLADPELAARFGLISGARLAYSRLVHFEGGSPIQLEERWVEPQLAVAYLAQDFHSLTPNEFLVRAAPLARVEYTIEARQGEPEVSRVLLMEPGEAALVLQRRTWSQGRVASLAHLWHPGSRYRFAGHFATSGHRRPSHE